MRKPKQATTPGRVSASGNFIAATPRSPAKGRSTGREPQGYTRQVDGSLRRREDAPGEAVMADELEVAGETSPEQTLFDQLGRSLDPRP